MQLLCTHPPSIFVPCCRYLSFAGNGAIGGSLPTFIGALTKLAYLDFSRNNLTGSVPTELTLLTNVKYVFLSSFGRHVVEPAVTLTRLTLHALAERSHLLRTG